MEHIFILNPSAGQGNAETKLLPLIKKAVVKNQIDYSIYITKCVGDAKQYVENICKQKQNVRFYACGGDGTLNEVINGAYGYESVEVANIPCGTGNDFPRSLDDYKSFFDVNKQINGESHQIDLIKCTNNKNRLIGYAINVINIGFDCDVVKKTATLKTYPFLSGTLAYYAGVLNVLFKKLGKRFIVSYDEGTPKEGDYLLTSIGNGAYYGGGFFALPRASITDGYLDVGTIKKVGRLKFISLVGKYKKGEHLTAKSAQKIVTYKQCKTVTIKPLQKMIYCRDGEVSDMEEITFSVEPKAINFSAPIEAWNKFIFEESKELIFN